MCIIPPYNCKPPSDGKWHGSQLLLLTKSGWLYLSDIENGEILDKIYIPTRHNTSNMYTKDEKIQLDADHIGKLLRRFWSLTS